MLERSQGSPREKRETTPEVDSSFTAGTARIEADLENRKGKSGFFPKIGLAGLALFMGLGDAVGQTSLEKKAELTPAQSDVFEKTVGINPAELKRDGYEITLQRPADAGKPYLIHFGQTHLSPIQGVVGRGDAEALENQKKIYRVLDKILSERKIDCIFREGRVDAEEERSIRDWINFLYVRFDRLLDIPVLTMDDVRFALGLIKDVDDPSTPWRSYLAERMTALREKMKKDLEVMAKSDNVAREFLTFLKEIEGGRAFLRGFQEGGVDDPLKHGAVFKLYMEGKIAKICGSEDPELNARALAVLERSSELRDELNVEEKRIRDSIFNNPEARSLLEELKRLHEMKEAGKLGIEDEAYLDGLKGQVSALYDRFDQSPERKEMNDKVEAMKREYEKAIMDDREDFALTRVTIQDDITRRNGHTPGTSIIIYGSAHDFTRATEKLGEGRGLLKIEVKK